MSNNQFFEFHLWTSIVDVSLREYTIKPTTNAITKKPEPTMIIVFDDD